MLTFTLLQPRVGQGHGKSGRPEEKAYDFTLPVAEKTATLTPPRLFSKHEATCHRPAVDSLYPDVPARSITLWRGTFRGRAQCCRTLLNNTALVACWLVDTVTLPAMSRYMKFWCPGTGERLATPWRYSQLASLSWGASNIKGRVQPHAATKAMGSLNARPGADAFGQPQAQSTVSVRSTLPPIWCTGLLTADRFAQR